MTLIQYIVMGETLNTYGRSLFLIRDCSVHMLINSMPKTTHDAGSGCERLSFPSLNPLVEIIKKKFLNAYVEDSFIVSPWNAESYSELKRLAVGSQAMK